MKRYFFIILAVVAMTLGSVSGACAQHVETVDSVNIVNAIMGTDGVVLIEQSDVLTQRLEPNAVIKTRESLSKRDKKVDPHIRYRVQVFSDNNRQSAKANAEYRKRIVMQRMPGVPAYVNYEAPYWRVRVGNYQTEAEAVSAMKQIKSNFPAFSADIRVVRVRVD